MEIPFLVAGCGGHNDLPVPLANGQARGDHSFDKALGCYGYLTVTVSPHRLQIDMTQVTASFPETSRSHGCIRPLHRVKNLRGNTLF